MCDGFDGYERMRVYGRGESTEVRLEQDIICSRCNFCMYLHAPVL